MRSFPLLTLLVCLVASPCLAQDYGTTSNAERQLRSFKNRASSSNISKQLLERDRSAIGGFGVANITGPTSSSAPSRPSPPRSRSASFGVSSPGSSAKPFANITRAPTVSPYLGLFNESLNGYDDLNYQTNVRPRLQQQQVNRQLERETQMVNQRLNSMSARNPYSTTGDQNLMPTGHAATFQNYSRFYPGKSQRRRR